MKNRESPIECAGQWFILHILSGNLLVRLAIGLFVLENFVVDIELPLIANKFATQQTFRYIFPSLQF